jgi:hydrogenase expression/formation protein HypE
MRPGKLPPELLAKLLRGIPRTDPRVLVGSGVGEDAAAIDFIGGSGERDRILIAKTDPITFATDQAGWYAVHVNANDVACAGATPRWFLASALLPDSWEEPQIAGVFDQIVQACTSLGVSLVGGHTEITAGLDRPLIAGCMLGEVERRHVIRTSGAQAGDDLILTQGIAVEGTSVLAREAAVQLEQRGVDREMITRAQRMLFDPGISVVRAAQTLCAAAPAPHGIHSLHDPTEGGLASGLWELAEAAGLGATIEEAAVPVLTETRAVCAALALDPWGVLASGALLAAIAPQATVKALAALREQGIPAQVIGKLTPQRDGLVLRRAHGETTEWPTFDRDEVARYFDELATG